MKCRRAELWRRGWRSLPLLLGLGVMGCGKLINIGDEDVPWNQAYARLLGTNVHELTLAEQNRVLMEHIDRGLSDPLSSPYFLIGVLGCALWTVAYALLVKRGFDDEVNTLPLLAICLNFTWEAMAVFVLPNPSQIWTVLEWSWIVIDVALLFQLYRYGRAHQKVPEIRRHFPWIVTGTLLACFIGQLTFVLTFGDPMGFIVAFVINLVMSVLFVFLYFERREDLLGLSYPAAWLKMVGTLCTCVQCAVLLPALRPDVPSWGFLHVLYVLIFLFDALYVLLLWQRRRQLAM